MTVGLAYHQEFLNHLTGSHHPERPARLLAIVEGFKRRYLWERLAVIRFDPATQDWLLTAHSEEYLHRLQNACEQGLPYIDVPDSAICPQSYEVAQLAVGACLGAVDAVMAGEVQRAFCAIRPPGHHAEYDASMGFCLLNNIVIATHYARHRHGVRRVLIFDFDVHHGNGTQHAFEADPEVFYCSIHQDPRTCYPGTGYATEQGIDTAVGTTLNLPMPPGSRDEDYQRILTEKFLPAAEAFEPELVFVSAGFDSHVDDPLASIDLSDAGFAWMSGIICDLADRFAAGRLISILEGGYNLTALERCVAEHVVILGGG